jgi:hypothetical protein
MDVKIIDRIYEFVKVFSDAKTILVSTWDVEKIQNCIELATEIDFYLSEFKNDAEYKEHLFDKLVEKIKETKACVDIEKTIPSIDEFCNSRRILYRTLLINPYLGLDVLAYIIETYGSDKKEKIIEVINYVLSNVSLSM